MPIYEYRCDSCKTVVEKRQNFSDALLTECETCGGRLEKLLSAPSLQFKGTGWYVTDYAGKGKDSNGSSAGSGDSAKSDAADAKNDSKSDTKSDTKSEKKTGSDTKKSTSTATATTKKD